MTEVAVRTDSPYLIGLYDKAVALEARMRKDIRRMPPEFRLEHMRARRRLGKAIDYLNSVLATRTDVELVETP